MSAAGSVCRAVRKIVMNFVNEFSRWEKVYPLFLLPGDVPEEGNQSEVDEKQIIKSATVYRIAMVFSQDQDRGKPDNYQKAHNRG